MLELTPGRSLFALDLDGTLYAGEKAIPGAVELLRALRARYRVVFFTNNSTKTVAQVHEKMNRLGLDCALKELYTSSWATAQYLKQQRLDNVYLVGAPGLLSDLEANGLHSVAAEQAQHVVVGLDLEFHYRKIAGALEVLRKPGSQFIVCNEDRSFPVENGQLMPGCAAMVGAISAATGRLPGFVVGKPNTFILNRIAVDYSACAADILVVGDSFDSDMQMAINYGCRGVYLNERLPEDYEGSSITAQRDLYSLLYFIQESEQ